MAFRVKALYDYVSTHEDDLNFSVGQIITVTDEEDDDWYGGEYVDDAGTRHEGIFPRNFVEKYEPTAPPRPTRSRPKKEPEVAPVPAPAPFPVPEAAAPPAPPLESPKQAAPEPEPEPEPVAVASPVQTVSVPPPVPAPVQEPSAPKPTPPVQPAPRPAEAPSTSAPSAPKPAPSSPKPSSGPPPVSEKPSSFKDRIAAFNKAAAPPIAPFKPSNLSSSGAGFIKKPFVAPPPSRNAYIPPVTQAPVAKIYRREEDPEIKEQEAEALENAGKVGLVPTASTNEGETTEDQPKPMSLKERLALLQKQQMETAARHAEALGKKEKPKKPPKKRLDSQDAAAEGDAAERIEAGETSRTSTDEPHPPRVAHSGRRKSSKGVEPRDGNEADMSGAGDTTEDQGDLTEKDDSDGRARQASKEEENEQEAEEEEDDEEEEEDIDPEIRRREELRARMARMAGGMGMPGMGMPLFGAPAPILPKKKKAAPEKRSEEAEEPVSPTTRAPPVPLPGLMRPPPPPEPKEAEPEEQEEEEDESRMKTPHQESFTPVPSLDQGAPPPIPGGRPAPPPVPSESRPPPPPPPSAAVVKSPSEGSTSGDELSEQPSDDTPRGDIAQVTRAPPPPPPAAASPPPLPPSSPPASEKRRSSYAEEISSASPPGLNRRDSRPPPPPVPGSPPAPPPAQIRPPPPPPPTAAPPLRRVSTDEPRAQPPVPTAQHADGDSGEEEEITEYEGDYDTDIASSVPHKDALKSHQRESSFEDTVPPKSPTTEAPPIPVATPPRAGPPPVPSQPPREARQSVDMPRAPPPPPPKEEPRYGDDYDPYNYTSAPAVSSIPPFPMPSPSPHLQQSEELFMHETPSYGTSQIPRSPPPPPPPSGRPPVRQSLDVQRGGMGRRSVDVTRPSMESGYVANDIDLASHSGWWLQPNGLPPQLHGRKDIFFESEESSAADPHQGGRTIVTRDIYVLFQDYSQTIITVRFNPHDSSDVHIEQDHKPPPRALRQDQLEQSYERFGRAIGEAAAAKKDSIVGDGTPQALVYELLRPHKDALLPVGTRAYGALVYSNLANASTTQNDEIRAGDIVSIRNAKFQGKHGAMHAKYSMEVGKPDHVAIVAEWDGTKKKVRAWEQGRESKKVKLESFKLDDLRSGEVKIWRVMPRSWIGWEGVNMAPGVQGSGSGN